MTQAYANGELDREIVMCRVINAPRSLVYRAWVEPTRMFQWFGPKGFTCEVHQQGEVRVEPVGVVLVDDAGIINVVAVNRESFERSQI